MTPRSSYYIIIMRTQNDIMLKLYQRVELFGRMAICSERSRTGKIKLLTLYIYNTVYLYIYIYIILF